MNQVKLVLGTMTFGESVFQPQARAFLDAFLTAGGEELDTAYVYNEGESEKILGEALPSLDRPWRIATKVNPRITGRLDGEAARMQLNISLQRLRLDCVDTVYLHFPDPATPVEDVLSAMDEMYRQGKFQELGLSNFPAWMVADVWNLCDRNEWVRPTVYQGIYNPLTRLAENELNDCLNHFKMRFYAYNPMAGGLLTGRYDAYEEAPAEGRFTHRPNYQKRYWKKSFFDAVGLIRAECETEGISLIEATYRWLAFHSMLDGGRGDAILIGASKLDHLLQNMRAVQEGPLSDRMVRTFEEAWQKTRADSPAYFTLYRGKGSVGG